MALIIGRGGGGRSCLFPPLLSLLGVDTSNLGCLGIERVGQGIRKASSASTPGGTSPPPPSFSSSLLCPARQRPLPEDLQVKASRNFFSVLGLEEVTFDIDGSTLEKRYKDLQRIFHPDKHGGGGGGAAADAASASARVNFAVEVLRNPLRRAKHILELMSGKGEGEEEGETIADMELLSMVMEAREAVEDARGDEEELRRLKTEYDAEVGLCMASVSAAFRENGTSEGADDAQVAAVAKLVVRLTYLTKIVDEINQELPPQR